MCVCVCLKPCGRLYLNLLHRQVQESVLIAHADQALGALAAHAGAQASVQLHHHQLVEALGNVVGEASGGDPIVGLDLEERQEAGGSEEHPAPLFTSENNPSHLHPQVSEERSAHLHACGSKKAETVLKNNNLMVL